tara:strand:- start:76 stop:222 length:147 start_codon:yes stop_codon:yes gene_type:complete
MTILEAMEKQDNIQTSKTQKEAPLLDLKKLMKERPRLILLQLVGMTFK